MMINKTKKLIFFLIIGLLFLLLVGCNINKFYTIDLPFVPISTELKIISSSQIAFKLNTSLPIKITVDSKTFSIYPFIIQMNIYSDFQYVIDPYTSFILAMENQIFFPKYPSEILKTILKDLLFENKEKLLILSPIPQKRQLIYFLPFNPETKILKLILNINGKIYLLKL